MSGQHRATPEQWAEVEGESWNSPRCSTILELRARVEALEATQRPTASAEARPGGLAERVAEAINPLSPWRHGNQARAAIREVAAWLRTGRLLHAADLLELEADR